MILGVIPAGTWNKAFPIKNSKTICGKPLIAWSIIAAQNSKLLDDFVVSTNDPDVAEISRSFGVKVLNDPNKAQLKTTLISLLQHIIEEFNPDYLLILQPSSPIRDENLIDKCISKFFEKDANYDNLATGFYCKYREFGTYYDQQDPDFEGFFSDDGNIFIIKKEIIQEGRWSGDKILKIPISKEQNHKISDEVDFFIIQKLLEKRLIRGISKNLQKIKILAIDVDGVLTDGGMYYSEDGNELKKFSTRDGKGIELIRKEGIKTAILTQEETEIVKKRAQKLQINYLYQNVQNKLEQIKEIALKEKISLEQVAYIGDDLNDFEILQMVGFSATPSDGVDEIKKIVDYVCNKRGGRGCVREICDMIITSRK